MTFTKIYDLFWDEKLWFPEKFNGTHYGWKDLQNEPGSQTYMPQIRDLHWGIVLGVGFVMLRFMLARFVMEPIGYKLGIPRQRKSYIAPNPLLETAYKQQNPDYQALSKQTDWTVRQVEVWFRKRKKMDATPIIRKFCDSGWNFVFYTTSFIYGLCVLWNKPWFTRSRECWVGWPQQSVPDEIYWYYMIELAFYTGLIFTLVTDHRRSDFRQLVLHHIATIILLYFSWTNNLVRVGTLVLVIHDASDPWVEMAKICIYLKRKTATDVFFVMFVLVWTVARHFLLPYVVLYTTTFEVMEFITGGPAFVNYFFNFFLYLLMIITCIWSYTIYKMVYRTLTGGDVKDSRSDSEEDNISQEQRCTNGKNGTVDNVSSSLCQKGNNNSLESNSTADER